MHVLFISSDIYDPDSIEMSGIFQKQFSSILINNGYKVGLISSGVLPYFYTGNITSGFSYSTENNLNVVRSFSKFFFPARFLLSFPSFFLFKKFNHAFEFYVNNFGLPELIHCQNSLFAGFYAFMLRRKGINIPTIITEHSSMYSRNLISRRDFDRVKSVIEFADLFTVVSNYQRITFEELFDFKKSLVLNNQIDPLFEINSVKLKNYNPEKFVFITVGNLDNNKNQKIILIALRKLIPFNKNIFLKIIGDGPCLVELKKMVIDFNLEKHVTFLKKLGRIDLLNEMNNSNALIVSSFVETFGVVALEGLFLGLPCISTKCGGTSEFLNDNNSIMIDVNDSLGLSEAMNFMYSNFEKFDLELIKKEVLQNFGLNTFLSRVNEYYKKTKLNFISKHLA
jgi:glycosyltransferase involved in cell wall biosynthesis